MKKAILCLSLAAQVYATVPTTVGGTGPLYTVGFNNGVVYSIDVQNKTFNSIGSIPGVSSLDSITLIDRNTAYIGRSSTHTIYRMNLQNGSSTAVVTFPGNFDVVGVAILNETTAFATGFNQDIYTFNQQTGQISLFAHIPSAVQLFDIQILNDSLAYVTDGLHLYSLNLKTGAADIVTTFPTSVDPGNLQLANNTTAYIAGADDANIYTVDLTTGAITQITPAPVGSPVVNDALFGMVLDKNTLYAINSTDNKLFVVDPQTGLAVPIVTIGGAGLVWASLYLQMVTNGLSGNNLKLANYLNTNAPQYVIRSFALQAGGLPAALEAASPARNAFTTYASQTAYLASSQLLIDHSRRVRLKEEPAPALTTDASHTIRPSPTQTRKKHNVWFTPFGESAHEKKQRQTPAFTTAVGGGLLGYDYTTECGHSVGAGTAYVYTHVHEEDGMGKARINQGFGTVYTTLVAGPWYSDISIWGGYYASANTRNIKFPGVNVKAQSTIHGWQTAGHFEAGYDQFYSWFGVQPFAMVDWVGNWEHAFREHGARNFNMGQKGRFASLLRTEGGLRLHEMIKFENGSYLLFREKASYAYQKAFKTGHITSFLVGSPGSFTVATLTGAQNLGVLEFSLGYYDTCGAYFEARYQGQYGSRYSSHQGMFEFGWDF